MIYKQDLPLISRFSKARLVSRSSIFNHDSRCRLTVCKRAAVAWISEHLKDSSAARQSPENFLPGSGSLDVWQRDLLFTKPDGCLPRTPELMKLLKDGGDRLLHLTVWRLF